MRKNAQLGIQLASALLGLCVNLPSAHGKATAGRFVVATDKATVHDTKTKLTWQRNVASKMIGWAEAKVYCAGNAPGLPGTGWRLPGINELLSIVDRKEYEPAIDPAAFPNIPALPAFWSGTPFKLGPSGMTWVVHFTAGNSVPSETAKYVGLYVRCVR
jgi:hypothetical protein